MLNDNKKNLMVIYGTRPEAIKLAPLIYELKKSHSISTFVLSTGQHKELLSGIFDLWGLKNDLDLNLEFEKANESVVPRIIQEVQRSIGSLLPDMILVQGDTSSALAGALFGYSNRVPVAHLEAGLRSGDMWNPWPEEAYRKAIDALSSLHFAPTDSAMKNLKNEGYKDGVYKTGNTVIDSIKFISAKIDKNSSLQKNLQTKFSFDLQNRFILFTQHRREGFGFGQEQVFQAISEIADLGYDVVFPVHLNPNVRDKAEIMLSSHPHIHLTEPLMYLEFVLLTKLCALVISDSGGIQEEIPFLNKRVIITRLTTERPEVVEEGFGKLVGFDKERIIDAVIEAMEKRWIAGGNQWVFGNGETSKQIVDLVEKFISSR